MNEPIPDSTEIVSVEVIIRGDYCSDNCPFLDSYQGAYDLCQLFGDLLKNQTEVGDEILTNRCYKCKQRTHSKALDVKNK